MRSPSGAEAITGEHLLTAKCELDRIGSHPGDQAGQSLVPDLPQLRRPFAFADDDPTDMHVARPRHPDLLRCHAHSPPDLGDRKRLVVEPPDRTEKPSVVPRSARWHPEMVTAEP